MRDGRCHAGPRLVAADDGPAVVRARTIRFTSSKPLRAPDGPCSLDSHLIPPPRVHRHRYHGVLAPNARLRARVIALGRDDLDAADLEEGPPEAPGEGTAVHAHEGSAATLIGAAARSRWARLLARIYDVFPLRCPECGATMRILAFLTDPQPTGAILRHLELPPTPPRLSPARAPPQAALALDPDPVADVDPIRVGGRRGESPARRASVSRTLRSSVVRGTR